MSFDTSSNKISIGSLDEEKLKVEAQYNPATLEVSQTVPWKKPDAATQGGGQGGTTGAAAPAAGGGKADKNYMALEFTGAEGRTISVELLFDSYETKGAAGGRSVDVAGAVKVLETLASVRKPGRDEEEFRRPHHCVVVWGSVLPKFQCVIEGLTTKYTMFSKEGVPLRATCTVKLKEAARVDKKGA